MSDSNKEIPNKEPIKDSSKKPIKQPIKSNYDKDITFNNPSKKVSNDDKLDVNTSKENKKDTKEKKTTKRSIKKSIKKKSKDNSKKNSKDKTKKDKSKKDKTKKEEELHPEYDETWYHIGKRSKFSQKHFDRYDIPARRVVREIFGEYIKDNPDQYGPDMIIVHPKCKYQFLEIQVCAAWKDDKYPFSTVFLYSRKMRYGPDTLFLTLNDNLSRGFLFSNKGVNRDKPRRLKKWSRIFVYDVPWNYVSEIILAIFKKHVNFCLERLS